MGSARISAADRVEILVLVDNVTDNLSSVPAEVENEWPRLLKRGMRQLAGQCLCCGAYGFFFQAEDGIRDLTVTGVQTCALPILLGVVEQRGRQEAPQLSVEDSAAVARQPAEQLLGGARSEERRVGKEGRYRRTTLEFTRHKLP